MAESDTRVLVIAPISLTVHLHKQTFGRECEMSDCGGLMQQINSPNQSRALNAEDNTESSTSATRKRTQKRDNCLIVIP